MKKLGIFVSFIVLSIILISFVSAIPPFQQTADIGIQIETPIIEYLEQGEDYDFHIHTHNFTNGLILTNDTTFCIIHIYNSTGNHIIRENMTFTTSERLDFQLEVDGNNFTELGQYSVLFYCEVTGEIGGFFEYGFIVNKLGQEFNVQEALIYILLSLAILGVFILALYFAIVIPYSNKIDENKGTVIKVTRTKYIKLFFISLSYVLFVWFLNVLIGVSDNFVSLTMFYGFIGFLFDILNRGALPFIIFIFVLSLFEIIRDANLVGDIKKWGSA